MRGARYIATFLTKQFCRSTQAPRLEELVFECKLKVQNCQPKDSPSIFCRRQLHTCSTTGTPAGALPTAARNLQHCLSRNAQAKGVRQYNNYSWNARWAVAKRPYCMTLLLQQGVRQLGCMIDRPQAMRAVTGMQEAVAPSHSCGHSPVWSDCCKCGWLLLVAG